MLSYTLMCGIERVALEHHGDVAVLGRHVVDDAVADHDAAFGDLFQAGQQAQAGGLAAARRADEDQEFLVGDLDVQVVDGDDVAEALEDMFVGYTGHRVFSLLGANHHITHEMAGQTELFGRVSRRSRLGG